MMILIASLFLLTNLMCNSLLQVEGAMIYATMEIPKVFSILNPQDFNATLVNLDKENYFMAAAGPLRPDGPDMVPSKHRQANVAANTISMGPPTTSTTTSTTAFTSS